MRRLLLALVIVTLAAAGAFGARDAAAMTADPNPAVVRQPDGTPITIFMRGDEWLHWYEDQNGFTIVQDGASWKYAEPSANGEFVATRYAIGTVDPAAAGLVAGRHPTLSAELRRERSTFHSRVPHGNGIAVAPTGTVSNLVVLCLFSDQTVADSGRDRAAYDSLFNQVNSTGFNAPTGSVWDYYFQASYHALSILSTVTTWVTLPHTEAYYANNLNGLPGGATPSPYPNNAAGMIHDALPLVDALYNLKDFDSDNDGYVDAITFIHSGYGGEQAGNGKNMIWSHKGNLSSGNCGGTWTSADQNANGVNVKVDLYHTEPARWGGVGNASLVRVGVIAHELGHFFGLPDLYDTDLSSFGIGNWCLMANSWGWDGQQLLPPLPSAWCRIQLGWATAGVPAGPGAYALDQAETVSNVVRINSGMPAGEYLLIENRQPVGFDQGIPQGGLAIWHIDDNVGANTAEGFPGQSGWPGNGNHYKVALLQADGAYNLEKNADQGGANDLYRSVAGIALNEATTPTTNRYQGGGAWPTGVEISEVSAPGFTMSFRYRPATWLDVAYGGVQVGTFDQPYRTLSAAIGATPDDAIVISKAGTATGFTNFTRPMFVKTYGGVTTVVP